MVLINTISLLILLRGKNAKKKKKNCLAKLATLARFFQRTNVIELNALRLHDNLSIRKISHRTLNLD